MQIKKKLYNSKFYKKYYFVAKFVILNSLDKYHLYMTQLYDFSKMPFVSKVILAKIFYLKIIVLNVCRN